MRDKWENRFGFARFIDVQNEKVLERKFDQIMIRNGKMNVNIPKFRRDEKGLQEGK